MSTLTVSNLRNSSNSVYLPIESIRNKEAFANFYYSVNDAAGNIEIANSSTYGATMAFNVCPIQKNIIGNTGNFTWTHSLTGYYLMTVSYRQGSGADIWTVLAICKNGPANAVGVSARTGSEDSHNENYSIIYPVDDTAATYQLQHWVHTTTKTVSSDFASTPGWNGYAGLINNRTGDTGRMVDYVIRRLGDL